MVLSKDLKFAICFGLIVGVIFSFYSLSFASEPDVITPFVSSNLVYNNTGYGGVSGKFVSGSYNILYFPIEPGYKYILTGSGISSQTFSGFTNEAPSLNVEYYDGNRISFSNEYVISSIDNPYNYAFFTFTEQPQPDRYFTITRVPLEGMNNFIDNIAYSLSFGNLSDVWIIVVPILAISVLFGLGFYFIKRIMNKTKRAKGGM